MYQNYYGLKRRPFDLTPVGGLVYLSESHKEGIAILRYGIIADKGFVLLTGGVGTGKTTLLNTLLLKLKDDKIKVCVLNNPTLTRDEFYYYLGKQFSIESQNNKSEFILQFSDLLENYDKTGSKVLLLIDEAQAFSVELLEEIRLLSNLAGDKNVLSTFLIGQPELRQKLSHPKLLPLRQRIGVTFHLDSLTREDTTQYIAYRLNYAGAANPGLFTQQAIDHIFKESHGNPRLINILCDNALVQGFSSETRKITYNIILDCVSSVKLKGEDNLQVSESIESLPDGSSKTTGRNHVFQSIINSLLALVTLTALGFAGVLAFKYFVGYLP